ncbi:MAG: Ca-activated chloride channel family protein [Arenicella sp.]|jgi:Ca-activated chloride channel family protein
MNDKDIDQLLDKAFDQKVPEPDKEAKQKAINLARNSFKQEFPQGSQASTRPIDTQSLNRDMNHAGSWISVLSKSIRSHLMNFLNNKTAYTAFGTAAVAFVAVSMVYQMPTMQTQTKRDDLVDSVASESADLVKATAASRAPIDKDSPQVSLLEEVVTHGGRDTKFQVSDLQTIAASSAPVTRPATAKNDRVELDRLMGSNSLAGSKPVIAEGRALRVAEAESSVRQAATVSGDKPAADKKTKLFELQTHSASVEDARSKLEKTRPSKEAFAGSVVGSVIAPSSSPIDIQPPNPAARLDDAEEYTQYTTNSILQVSDQPVSTFSIDVDTASYSLVRNQLQSGRRPKPQAVRAEELINYFDYDYAGPDSNKQAFQPTLSVFDSPWNADRKLVHIGIKGYDIPANQAPDSNIVFLLDVSGSMNSANKLPLVKQSLSLLLNSLKPSDKVSVVVYAGAAGTVLEPTEVRDKAKIMQALQRLNAGGSTAGGAGISLAYQLAEQNFNKQGVNRIILATDGDFNVGQSSNQDLKTLVERKRDSGIFLSVLGFGRNNYKDDMMQTLAQNGNGVAAYIDTLSEAKKVLVDEATSTLFPIAKDVKIQVEFNPAMVSEYRLVGYETRALNREDFNNDNVDAGDIGAGHTVTAIYEITPADAKSQSIDEPRYAANRSEPKSADAGNEYGFLKMRYKLPNGTKSNLIEQAILNDSKVSAKATVEANFSIAVAGFAQLLSNSKYVGDLNYDKVIEVALANKGRDPFGYRSEFIQLARMAKIAQP